MEYKKDSHVFGAILGLIIPIIGFVILWGAFTLINEFYDINIKSITPTLKLVAIALNLIVLRYYFVNLKYEMTGRGILLVTFIFMVVYFWLLK